MSGAEGRRLLDEALRLLDLAQAARPAAAGRDATDPARPGSGPECCICPVCRGIAALREVDPRAVERLTGAVTDVAAAVRDLLGGPEAPSRGRGDGADDGAGDRADDGARDRADDGADQGAQGSAGGGGLPRVRVEQIDVTD